MAMNWDELLTSTRRKPRPGGTPTQTEEFRTEIERDYDRILFSTALRRLADKTQVFPLEKLDGVRTRLTHSFEVSALARAIGTYLAFESPVAQQCASRGRDLPAVLATIGLFHDLGNPPFGHQGEEAIRHWMREHSDDLRGLETHLREDFLRFDGNAQTFRLLTRLQIISDEFGLNLTNATLAAGLKYPVGARELANCSSFKKLGFFESERGIVNEVIAAAGVPVGARHPLTFIMEACDDMAYSVLDVEDACKKGLVSFHDVVAALQAAGDDEVVKRVVDRSCTDFKKHSTLGLSPSELNDVSMQKFRVHSITAMAGAIRTTFVDNERVILDGDFDGELISSGKAAALCKTLKDFARERAYKHRTVLELELRGFRVIVELMNLLWKAIRGREIEEKLGSRRRHPFNAYAYGRISENYRRVFESPENPMPTRYKELQLLTDMISGMTDSYALALHDELQRSSAAC